MGGNRAGIVKKRVGFLVQKASWSGLEREEEVLCGPFPRRASPLYTYSFGTLYTDSMEVDRSSVLLANPSSL